jgi:hypothetical protein
MPSGTDDDIRAMLNLTCTFHGLRQEKSREVAVITVAGELAEATAAGVPMKARVSGEVVYHTGLGCVV